MKNRMHSYQLAIAADQNIKEREYWLNKLSGPLVKSYFPYDYSKKAETGNQQQMKSEPFIFPNHLFSGLMNLCKGKGVDVKLHMILTAGLFVLLNKYTGSSDIMIGSPLLKQETEGNFINSVLVFRNQVKDNESFKNLLLAVRETIIEANKHQNYPLERILTWIDIPKTGKEFPFFDVVILLENLYDKNFIRDTYYNMGFSFLRSDKTIEGAVQYNSSLYGQPTIKQIIHHYMHLMEQVLSDVNIPVSHLQLLSPEEKKQILVDYNRTESEYRKDKTLQQLFDEQAANTPDHIAVIGAPHEMGHWAASGHIINGKIALTYKELNHLADQVANVLMSKGVQPDTVVGLMVEFSIETIVGLMAILKAGGAYLPLDPDYPLERIRYMLTDTNARILLTVNTLTEKDEMLKEWGGERINIIHPFQQTKYTTITHPYHNHPTNLCYIIYTSGTTGKPKGIMVEHRNVIAYLHAFYQEFKINPKDTSIQLTSYSFDLFIEEVFPLLLKGGKIVMPTPLEIMDIGALSGLIVKQQVNIIDCTPLLLNEFNQLNSLNVTYHPLKYVPIFISGGDVLKEKYIDNLLKIGKVYNTYGPTEATICATYYRLPPPLVGNQTQASIPLNIPIGKPIANYKVYILDKNDQPVPIGIDGEICVSGPGITRGYLNRPELTSEKFCLRRPGALFEKTAPGPHKNFLLEGTRGLAPLLLNETGKGYMQSCNHASMQLASHQSHHYTITPLPNFPIYFTGDQARWLPDNNIEFLGRKDQQVKIRGYRIEIGEIEYRLLNLNNVKIKQALVMAAEGKDGDKKLCAYIVSDTQPEVSDIRKSLAAELPDYMIPSFFLQIDKIPLTPTGKIDPKALPEPEQIIEAAYVAPENSTQEQIKKIWQETLDLEKIGIYDNFFAIGGHSINGIQVLNQIQKEFNVEIPLIKIFEIPTIKGLAEYVAEAAAPIVGENKLLLLDQKKNSPNHFFFVHDGRGEVDGYVEFCSHLTNDFNLWGIPADTLESYAPQTLNIEELASTYIEKIKKLQLQGPYYITGWSLGGTIAFEMVRQLEQINEEIGFLAMIDVVDPYQFLVKGGSEFTLETEMNFVQQYLPNIKINTDKNNVTGIKQFWTSVVEYLETNRPEAENLQKIITEYEAQVTAVQPQLNISELIKKINIVRSLCNARALYKPPGIIHTPMHYFAASESKFQQIIQEEAWNEFCSMPITFYQVPGDHYSIFRKPIVRTFAEMFSKILKD
jgi:amino acid adenylation domain-containing protein